MSQKPETRVERVEDRSFRVVAYLYDRPVGRYLIGIDHVYDGYKIYPRRWKATRIYTP